MRGVVQVLERGIAATHCGHAEQTQERKEAQGQRASAPAAQCKIDAGKDCIEAKLHQCNVPAKGLEADLEHELLSSGGEEESVRRR